MGQLVSIVVPAYQAEAHVEEALSTLMQQDWPHLDIVVVDDGSTDRTAEIVERVAAGSAGRVRLIRQENRGAGAARDLGIDQSRGNYVLLADADDRADPGLVRTLVAAIETSGADLAYARCRYIDAAGDVLAVQARQDPVPGPLEVLEGFMVNTPLVRKAALAAIGGHDRSLRASIDLDLRLRLAMRRPGAIFAVDKVLSDYRRTDGQITSDWRRMEASWTKVRDKAIACGLQATPGALSVMRGRHCVYWATLAYNGGDYPAARRLMLEAVWRVPGHVVRDRQALIRAASCLASYLPDRIHESLRSRFNARQRAQT